VPVTRTGKRFLPTGSDREAGSDFVLVAGTDRDLLREVGAGRFREDLLARINLWTFVLPPLRDRPQDMEPNIDYEQEAFSRRTHRLVRLVGATRERYLGFACSPDAARSGNFRGLSASVARMATLDPGGRITPDLVEHEIRRLGQSWRRPPDLARRLAPDAIAEIDLFDRVQLAAVLGVCSRSESLSDAGRTLLGASRSRRSSVNDADRLRKYLARFGLTWAAARHTGGA
jgi:transcriptional regulatory protein RtcR